MDFCFYFLNAYIAKCVHVSVFFFFKMYSGFGVIFLKVSKTKEHEYDLMIEQRGKPKTDNFPALFTHFHNVGLILFIMLNYGVLIHV